MRIWAIAEWFPHSRNTSHGIFAKRHIEALCKNNAEVELCLVYAYAQADFEEFKIKFVPEDSDQQVLIEYPHRKNFIARFLAYRKAMKIARIVLEEKLPNPDLIWVHEAWRAGIYPSQWSKKLKIPMVISEHWTGYSYRSGEFKRWSFATRRWISRIFRQSRAVVSVSKSLKGNLKALFKIQEIPVIGNVVEPIAPSQEKYPEFSFIHISTLGYQKNVPLLLEAFKLHLQSYPKSHLRIVGGEGDGVSVCQSMARNLGLSENVTFEGHKNPEQIPAYLQHSHALVMTSRYETFSIVIAEAWSAGIPVVSTQVGGLTDNIPLSHGFSVIKQEAKDVSLAMGQIIENYSNYNPHEISESMLVFSEKNIGGEYYQLFKRLIAD